MRIYEVQLLVSGPVTISRAIQFNTEKELHIGNIFNSNIGISKHAQGFLINSTIRTTDQERAYKLALLFVGRMLDVMAIRINCYLNVTMNNYKIADRNIVRTVITEAEFAFSFRMARDLNIEEPRMLRAFSWYRKALYTEDPFDKFMAFWNAIGVVADGYSNDNARTRLGIVNKIWDCFITLWGSNHVNWEYVNGDAEWINANNDIRNRIAHGGITIDVEYVDGVISRLPTLQDVAYSFLSKWAAHIERPVMINVEI